MQMPLLGELIRLKGYEFMLGDTKRSYGDTSNAKAPLLSQVKIKACGGTSSLIVQTSGYADFAGKSPEPGNGDITAIYSIYYSGGSSPSNSNRQFIIRDTTDVKFSGPRCFLFEEDFGSYPYVATADTLPCANIPGWQNITEEGNRCYTISSHNSGTSIYAKISQYVKNSLNITTSNTTSWLITPGITLPTGTTPKFTVNTSNSTTNTSVGVFKILISTDYNGTSQHLLLQLHGLN